MIRKLRISLLFFLCVLISGCAALQPGYEKPVVNITSFEAVPGQGIIPQFKIGLHIVNPNRTPLDLKGIAYTIYLEKHKIMTGVSNALPKIDAYGEADVALTASVDLFNSIGFLSELVQGNGKEKISYSLKAKLDAGTLYPLIRVAKEGVISLGGPATNGK